MIKLLTLLFLISLLTAIPPSSSRTSESHTALLRYLHRRSIGCYSGCQSCNTCSTPTSCSSSCNTCVQNCCQNNCHVCQQPVCQQHAQCSNCCYQYCPPQPTTAPSTTTTSTTTTTTSGPSYSTSSTSTTRPTVVPPIVVSPTYNNNVDVRNNLQQSVSNYLKNENRIHIPINIHNENRLYVSNRVSSACGSSTNCPDPIISTTTPGPTKPTTSSPTHPPPDNNEVIIIILPQIGYYLYPVVNLPCINYGHSCVRRRTYWSGNVCGGWSGYGSHWGSGCGQWGGCNGLWSDYGSGWDWSGFSGCRTVSQDCGACGSNFYNVYSRGSWQYNSCYGCFI